MPLPFLVALQFLTIIPVRLGAPPGPRELGESLNWYGAVGALIGVLLVVVAWIASLLDAPMVAAALVLVAWVGITGALHLDGLGDCADGCMGASRARALEIMNDPRAGAMAVAAIALVLITKFAALATLLQDGHIAALLAAPILARAGVQALFVTTPAARDDGLAAALADAVETDRVLVPLIAGIAIAAVLIGWPAWWILPLVVLVFVAARAWMMRRLLGTTGDSAGALVEVLETALLVLAAGA